MIHLTPADYRRQPWANGQGTTTELYRADSDGALIFRLSMAAVIEDGPFSLFPGIERNLTVLTGPGFSLEGKGISLKAKPLTPIAFPGDVALRATGVTAPSDDFNVMTARHLPLPKVAVIRGPTTLVTDGLLAILALNEVRVNGVQVHRHELILTQDAVSLIGSVIAVDVAGVPSIS